MRIETAGQQNSFDLRRLVAFRLVREDRNQQTLADTGERAIHHRMITKTEWVGFEPTVRELTRTTI